MKTRSKVLIAVGIVFVGSFTLLAANRYTARSHFVGTVSCSVVHISQTLEDDDTVKTVVDHRCPGRKVVRVKAPDARTVALKQDSSCDKWVVVGGVFRTDMPTMGRLENCTPKASAS